MAALERSIGQEPHEREKDAEHQVGNLLALWFGLLGAPTAWVLGLSAEYALVEVACTKRTMLPLHLASTVTLLLALGAGWLAYTQWDRLGRGWAGEAGDSATRSRFMAVVGVMISALFVLAIVAQWLGTAFLHPCMGI